MLIYIIVKQILHCQISKMCTQCQQCRCFQSNPNNCLCFSIQINQPFECVCVPNGKQTSIETSDVVAGLLKYNSNLTKYLHKYQNSSKPKQQLQNKNPDAYIGQVKDPKKSIVQIYNLKVLPPGSLPNKPTKQEEQKQIEQQNKHKKVDFEQQTSPRNWGQQDHGNDQKNKKKKPKQPKYPPGSNEQKLQKHFKEVSASSRYLPNTGFKKYFGRECFENYGRMNTTGVADGIVYGNYLKTFNISPHCSTNMPITEQTHRHALIAGNNQKYDGKKVPQTHYGNKQDREDAEGYHKKPLSQIPEVIEQSKKYHDQQQKYTIRLPQQAPQTTEIKRCEHPEYRFTTNGIRNMIINQNEGKSLKKTNIRRSSSKKQISEKATKQFEQEPKREVGSNIKADRDRQKIQQVNRRQRQQEISSIAQKSYQDKRMQQNKHSKNGQYERWDDEQENQETDMRWAMKKQIMSECFRNNQVAHALQRMQKPLCSLCRNRRFTKCCCVG